MILTYREAATRVIGAQAARSPTFLTARDFIARGRERRATVSKGQTLNAFERYAAARSCALLAGDVRYRR